MSYTKYIFIFCVLCLSLNYVSSVCIMGDNCPPGKGMCQADTCYCFAGYSTLLNEQDPKAKTVYCNYEQKSRWIAFFLEFLLPPLGILYLGKYIHFLIKLSLIIYILVHKKNPREISGWIVICFIGLYFADFVCLLFGVYYDGNGVPLY